MPGNCLCGAIWLWIDDGCRGKIIMKTRWRNGCIPHFFYKDRVDNIWHFRFERDILPHPFSHLFFVGRFDLYKRGKNKLNAH